MNNLAENSIQYAIIFCLAVPFLIPFMKKYAKQIPVIQIITFMSILLYFYNNSHLLPIIIIFGGWNNHNGIEILLNMDSVFFLAAAYIVFLSVIIYSLKKKHNWKFYFLINLLLSDLTCLFMANDLFNIYVTLELMSLISYLLISVELKNRQIWSSLKYMLLSAVSFNIYLVATGMLYNQYGTLNLSLLSKANSHNSLPYLILVTALLVKSGIFFYSMWLPSAHSDSESSISAILSGVIVNAGIFHVLRLNQTIDNSLVSQYIIYVGIISAIFGAYFSVKQKDIKLILAFSTMSQMGFVLEGWNNYGAEYAFSHSIFKGLLFMAAGYYQQLHATRNINTEIKKVPLSLFIAIWIGYLSISGLPFFLGSFYKHEIIVISKDLIHFGLIFATLGSVISIGKFAFNIKPSKKAKMSLEKDLALLPLAFTCIVFGTVNSLNHLDMEHLLEPEIFFGVGVFILFLFSKKIKIHYPYKLFKLSHVITIYSVIIGVIVTMTYLVF